MKTVIIANPASGGFSWKTFDAVVEILKSKLDSVDVRVTQYPGHATDIAKTADADCFISAGGDGIINEVINGIHDRLCVFFPLPFGTANVFCREYGIPVNPVKAARRFDVSKARHVHLGRLGSRYFSLMAGFGYDAEVVKRVTFGFGLPSKKLAHVVHGMFEILFGRCKPFRVFHGGEEIRTCHAIVSVARKYAGEFPLVDAIPEGQAAICLIEKEGRGALLKSTLSMGLGRGFAHTVRFGNVLKIDGPRYCQLDGEFVVLDGGAHFIRVDRARFMLATG